MSIKNSSESSWDRTSDLAICSTATWLYIVTDISNIKRYLVRQRNVTGKRKRSAKSTIEICNISENSISQIILSKKRKFTSFSAPDQWVNLPVKIKNTVSRKISNKVLHSATTSQHLSVRYYTKIFF
jgi:hypothetical protein